MDAQARGALVEPLDARAERLDRGERRERVGVRAEAGHLASTPSQTAPISSERCEIDLSPGTAISPTSAAAGAISSRSASGRGAHARSASTGAASAP